MPNSSRKTIFTTISIDKETAALVEKICKRYSLKKSEVVKLAFGYFVYSIRIVIAYFLLDFFILCIYAISSIFQYVSNEFIKERPNIKVNREESINDTMQEEYGNLPKYLKIIFIISFILAMLYVLF